jgi:hypothetical protein
VPAAGSGSSGPPPGSLASLLPDTSDWQEMVVGVTHLMLQVQVSCGWRCEGVWRQIMSGAEGGRSCRAPSCCLPSSVARICTCICNCTFAWHSRVYYSLWRGLTAAEAACSLTHALPSTPPCCSC